MHHGVVHIFVLNGIIALDFHSINLVYSVSNSHWLITLYINENDGNYSMTFNSILPVHLLGLSCFRRIHITFKLNVFLVNDFEHNRKDRYYSNYSVKMMIYERIMTLLIRFLFQREENP